MKRVAVSVMLHPHDGSQEVLLVERHPDLKFFGGYMAFPGGTLEDQDETVPAEYLRNVEDDNEYRTFVAAAAREIFEETGIWMAKGSRPLGRSELEQYRRRLLDREISFGAILNETGHVVDGRDFVPLCRITSPPFVPVRYDTWFVRCRIPQGQSIEIVEGELVGGRVVAAGEILEQWRQGDVLIAAPVIIILKELARRDGNFVERVKGLTDSYARGKIHRIYFTPGVLLAPLKTVTQPPATHTNTFVVGHERLYVVDPAPTDLEEQEKLWEFLDELRDEGRSLEGILLTHAHPDHIGAVAACQKRYDLPVFAHEDAAKYLPDVEFQSHIEHGQVIDLGRSPDGRPDWQLRAFHTPGHAPGHLAYEESRYGALLVGDLISTLSSILIDPSDGHMATYLDSLRAVESIARGVAYPSHGHAARDGKAAIRQQILHRQEREDQILRSLTQDPQNVDELVKKVYTDVDVSLHGLAKRSLLSGLIKLEEESRATHTGSGFAFWHLRSS
jgi:glyoxylase-like metal-dependent hydrolase (beta-lactamase superfamily II)/8-oxo-dGTP pyrophosphatase MutT (NUDIX family)